MRGSFARFGLAVLVLTLAIYLPYFWQSWRFMLAPAALLGIGAAGSAVRSASWLRSQLRAREGSLAQRLAPSRKRTPC